MTGVSAVAGRLADIQGRLATLTGTRPAAGSVGAFAAVLADAENAGGAVFPGAVARTTQPASAGPGPEPSPAGAGAAARGDASGTGLVDAAMRYLGTRYVRGGEDATGMDCSGLVQRALADLGIPAPRVARDQAWLGTEVPSLAQARPGDLIVTRGGAHIAIYLGDNRIVHAPRPGESVGVRELFETDADIDTIRRVLPTADGAGTEAGPAGTGGAAGASADPARWALEWAARAR